MITMEMTSHITAIVPTTIAIISIVWSLDGEVGGVGVVGVRTTTVVTSGVAADSVTRVSVIEVSAFWIFVAVASVLKVSNEGASI